MSTPALQPRHRLRVLLWLPLIVVMGLATRSSALPLPRTGIVATYGGDTLYAVLIFALLAFLRPAASTARLGVAAALVCLLIELSQLLDWAPLSALRAHRLGALVLGRGFVWSDLLCYLTGAALAAGADQGLRRLVQPRTAA